MGEELAKLDRWIRNNTVDRFGPVRAVRPDLVLEIAFDAVQQSSRHKSGIAMRFPRIKRIRWDKPAAEADRLHVYRVVRDIAGPEASAQAQLALLEGDAAEVETPIQRLLAYQETTRKVRNDGNGWMSTILRVPGETYDVYYDKVPLEQVANSERTFPKEWISADGLDVTDDFLRYAQPLIGDEWPAVQLENGLQRYTRFEPKYAEKKLAEYTPEAKR